MDEIKCPNCGKANPDVLLKCRYCGAELPAASKLTLPETTALTLPKDWEKSLTPADKVESSQESEADWLHRLRGDAGEAAPASEAAVDSGADDQSAPAVDNWLGRLRDQDETQTPEADQSAGAFAPSTGEAELPDWLKSMRSPDAEPSAPTIESASQTEAAGDGGDADWLKAFEPTAPPADAPAMSSLADWQNIEPGSVPEEEDDSDDWLKSFGDQPAQPAAPSGFSNYGSSQTADEETPAPKAEVDDDQWMKSLGAVQDTLPALGLDDFKKLAETPMAEEADDSDEWLKSLTTPAASEPETVEAESPESLPEWLRASTPPTATAGSGEVASPADSEPTSSEMPDWLNASAPPTPSVSAEGIPPVSDTDDWLSTFSKAESSAQPETPDWMKESTPPASGSKPEPDLTAWLSSVGGVVGGPEPSAEPKVTAPAPAAPMSGDDWLNTFKETAKSDPATADAARTGVLPDWLKSITSETTSGAATPSTSPAPPASGTPATGGSNLPDWLKAFKDTAKSDPNVAGMAQTGALPDWLTDLGAPPATESPAVDLPDWLNNANAAGGTPAGSAAEAPDWILSSDTDKSGNLTNPDWFDQIQSQVTKKPDTGKLDPSILDPFSLQSPTGSTPALSSSDWPDSPKTEKPAGTPAFEGLSGAATGQTGQLDWLKGLTSTPPSPSSPTSSELAFKISGERQPVAPAPGGTGPLTGSDLPAWLTEPQPTPSPTAPSAAGVPAFSNDLPDWLTAPPGETTTVTETAAPAPFSEPIPVTTAPETADLAKAKLPVWLGAMQPVNVPTHLNLGLDYEETVGPLAGMRGILPAESIITVPGKPGAVVTRFAVSDLEQQRANILRNIIGEETQDSEAKPVRKPRFSLAWDRLLIALLALVLVALPFIPGILPPGLFVEPARQGAPSQLQAATFANLIEGLPADSPVVVAFDYDPASTGELNPGASALVTHLMKRGIGMTTVSTYPAGVGVGQGLLDPALKEAAAEVKLKYPDAVFIPGGAVGLRRLVTAPETFFNNVSLIVVITGSAESAQAWIEQVQAPTGRKMALIISAAAEPLLRPYTQGDTPQLAAWVSGLSGGMAYQEKVGGQAARGPTPARQWDAYALGLNGASLMLLAGSVVGGVLMLMGRRNEPKPVKPRSQQKPEPQSELKRRAPKKKSAKKGSAAKATKKK